VDVRVRSNITFAGRDDGPVVMLAHGFGCDQNMWRQVTAKLGEQSRLLLFDHVGAGRSDLTAWDPDRYVTLDGYARDVLEICRDLDLRDVIFVGHSVSAMIGVLAAAEEPDRFAGLILLTPSPCYIDQDGYRGGFTLTTSTSCWSLGQQLSRMVRRHGTGDHGKPRPAGTGPGTDGQLLPH
jgi:sigma-B regulation protein RsbQ